MIVKGFGRPDLGVLRFVNGACHRPWRMRHRLPRVRSMRYLLGMTEKVGPLLSVVLDSEDVRCWRLRGLQGGSR